MKTKPKMVCIKLNRKEREEIRMLAQKYEAGNMSAWLRRAGREYIPGVAVKGRIEAVTRKTPKRVLIIKKTEDPGDFY